MNQRSECLARTDSPPFEGSSAVSKEQMDSDDLSERAAASERRLPVEESSMVTIGSIII